MPPRDAASIASGGAIGSARRAAGSMAASAEPDTLVAWFSPADTVTRCSAGPPATNDPLNTSAPGSGHRRIGSPVSSRADTLNGPAGAAASADRWMRATTRAVSPGDITAGVISTSTGGGVASAMPAMADRQNRSNAASFSARYRHASSAPETSNRPAPCGVTVTTASPEPLTRASTLPPGNVSGTDPGTDPGTVARGTSLAPGTVAPSTLAPENVRISDA